MTTEIISSLETIYKKQIPRYFDSNTLKIASWMKITVRSSESCSRESIVALRNTEV